MPTAITPNTTSTHHPPMRIGGAVFGAVIAPPAMARAAASSPDAELIRTCHRFAESELENWYRFEALDGPDGDLADSDWDTYHLIVATPAMTAEGWHAKALACAAWDRELYDDHEDDRDSCTTFVAALLRDMVAPTRNAIIARCAAKYGPLPSGYTAEGVWVGPTPEERAELKKRLADRHAARIAAVVSEHKGTQPPITNVPGQELIGVDEAGNMSLWSTGTIKQLSALENSASHPDYIDGGHYVIWWKRHAITVHLSGPRMGMVEVLFMCGALRTTRLLCDEVEALLIGKVSEDGGGTPDYWAERINEVSKLWQEARIAEAPSRRRGHISGSAAA